MVLVVLGAVRRSPCSGVPVVRRGGRRWARSVCGWASAGVAQASARGLVAREGSFLRTPKARGEVTGRDVLRGNPSRSGWRCCPGRGRSRLRPARLARPGGRLAARGAGPGAAPLNSLAAARAYLTPELRRRRREMLPSYERPRRRDGSSSSRPSAPPSRPRPSWSSPPPAGGPVPSDLPAQAIGPAPDRAPRAPGRSRPRTAPHDRHRRRGTGDRTPARAAGDGSRAVPVDRGPGARDADRGGHARRDPHAHARADAGGDPHAGRVPTRAASPTRRPCRPRDRRPR